MDNDELVPNEECIAEIDTSKDMVVRELKKFEHAQVKRRFAKYDENGDGTINFGEARRHFSKIMSELTRIDPDISDVTDLDQDSDRSISYKEFEYIYRRYLSTIEYKQAEMRAAFRMFDLDGNGYITKDELKVILCGKGQDKFGDEEADGLIEEADLNKDGKIDYIEFCYALFGEPPPPQEKTTAKKTKAKKK